MLPPVQLKFKLSSDYPSTSSPIVHVVSDWMSKSQIEACEESIQNICKKYKYSPVIYMCYEVVFNKLSNLVDDVIDLNGAAVCQYEYCGTVEKLSEHLRNQCQRIAEETFHDTLVDCAICYDTFKGRDSVQFLPCKHVYCKTCTHNYYRSLAQGIIGKPFQCLGDGCVSEAPQALAREALGEELFEKYEQSLLEVALSGISGIIVCPNQYCLKVACLSEIKTNLVECSYCEAVFCNACKQTFHDTEPCKFNSQDIEKIIEEWNDANDEEKEAMAKRFGGKENLKSIIEQCQSEVWIRENSKKCPNCAVSIEKMYGCHRMNCAKCYTNFCWLCNKELTGDNPYDHFGETGECKGRLFEGMADREANEEDDVVHIVRGIRDHMRHVELFHQRVMFEEMMPAIWNAVARDDDEFAAYDAAEEPRNGIPEADVAGEQNNDGEEDA